MSNKKIIVAIGGGTGVFTVLSGLKNYPDLNLKAIVSMADDGGSTGILREEFGILPPGDIRRALVALSHSDKLLAELFNYRFPQGGLSGHSFGNLLITSLERITGSFEQAVREAGKILSTQGEVIPVTLDQCRLFAKLENGEIIQGETNIDVPKHDGNLKIERIYLKPKATANPKAIKAILNADLVIVGPGDLYTSLIPNFLVSGVRNALLKTKAKKVYAVNLMTKFGETHNFSASDFVSSIENYIGKNCFDYILANNKKPEEKILKKYREQNARFVNFDKENLDDFKGGIIAKNFLRKGELVRHNSRTLAEEIIKLI
ncbi:MAG: YvcK family protein [Parcubacteria group bacterium]|nr:YvcK family protein [Parcubacteria group bacterium]